MKHKGFKDVYHLDGGIVKYGQEFGDDGFWEGKCYVFDKASKWHLAMKVRTSAWCVHCSATTSS